MFKCSKSLRMTHLPEIIAFLDNMIYLFSARTLIKGRLGLGVEADGTIDLPFSVLVLIDILLKKDEIRSKWLGLDLINKET